MGCAIHAAQVDADIAVLWKPLMIHGCTGGHAVVRVVDTRCALCASVFHHGVFGCTFLLRHLGVVICILEVRFHIVIGILPLVVFIGHLWCCVCIVSARFLRVS